MVKDKNVASLQTVYSYLLPFLMNTNTTGWLAHGSYSY